MRLFLVVLVTIVGGAVSSAQQAPVQPDNPATTPQTTVQPAPQGARSAPASPGTPAPATTTDQQPVTNNNDDSTQPAAGSQPSPSGPGPQSVVPPAGTPVVLPSSENRKSAAEAKRLFDAGVKLKSSGKLEGAFENFQRAGDLAPRNVEYVTAREITRQQLVMEAIQRGNTAMLQNNDIVAMAEFRQAVEYDPTNDFAQQRLHDSIAADEPLSRNLRIVDNSTEIDLQPSDVQHDFHYRGDGRTLLTQVAQAYGITAIFDDSVVQHRVHFDVEDVNFATAMELATRVTKTFWVPLGARQMLIAADTAENRRTFERMSLRTFYLNNLASPQELVELQNALRVLLDVRYIVQNPTQSTITIRAQRPILEAAAQLIASVNVARPEVLLDMNVYEVSSSLLRKLGNNVTTQWTLYNLSPALLGSLAGVSPNLINQLISSGGINQANSQAISALLAQLQQSMLSPILSTPVATFGGGLTLMGLTLGGFTINVSLNESDVRTLQHVSLRASQNTPAVLKIGERYPLINATYAPIYNSASISRVLGNQSYIAPFPSFYYEDIGLNLKATPVIHADKDVTLKLELQIQSLGTQSVNGQPIINNRQYTGTITLREGEAGVVAGLIGSEDARTLTGYPFLAQVPGLTYGISEHDKNVTQDELLVVITPRVLRLPERTEFAVQLPTGH